MYITNDDIINSFHEATLIELVNENGAGSVPDADKLTEISGFVNNLIDDSLRGRYPLPFTTVPVVLTDIAKQIAKYKCYENREAVSESMQKTYEQNMKLLKDYQEGRKVLDVPSPEYIPPFIAHNIRESKIVCQ